MSSLGAKLAASQPPLERVSGAEGEGPLAGKRVLLLRPERQSIDTAELVRRRGASAVVHPLSQLVPPPDPRALLEAARRVGGYDLVVFTSENAVAAFLDALAREGLAPSALADVRVAAIGRSTSKALVGAGVRVDVLPERFVAEDLGQAILDDLAARGGAAGTRVLLPRALVAREVIPEALRQAGAIVDVVPAYANQPAGPETRAAIRSLVTTGGIDVVLLTASSVATGFVEALGEAASALPDGVVIASIGEVTTSTATALGLRVDLTAPTSTLPGLLDAVEAYLAARAGAHAGAQ
jgi:uroporphyrinogen III methyltransferase/synthase